jgi:hypothetical protein
MGKRVKVPADLKGYCDPQWGGCGMGSETDGTETAVAELDKHWNGKFFSSLGWMAFFLPCPNPRCDRKVQYETKIWVGTL